MTATDTQVRIIMREGNQGRTQEQAAAKANMHSRKTVAKYQHLGKLPSELKKRRPYRTRTDPFGEDGHQAEAMLVQAPELEAKALFAWLCEQKENKYQEGQLGTFQRRVSEWKALNCQQVAVLEQIHRPGEVLQTDGTWLNELGVSIQGQRCKHLFIHCVLPYSNWEWGCLAQSESLMALRLGLQKTLLKLGSVPKYHKTDNSTAATHLLGASEQASSGKRRGYNHGYLQLLAHYSIEAADDQQLQVDRKTGMWRLQTGHSNGLWNNICCCGAAGILMGWKNMRLSSSIFSTGATKLVRNVCKPN